jgi:hypothetical protein
MAWPFADLPKNRNGASRRYLGAHIFDRVCTENGIEHRLTKPYHPWTNGQAERMNRTIKEATIKVFHYPSLDDSLAVFRQSMMVGNASRFGDGKPLVLVPQLLGSDISLLPLLM